MSIFTTNKVFQIDSEDLLDTLKDLGFEQATVDIDSVKYFWTKLGKQVKLNYKTGIIKLLDERGNAIKSSSAISTKHLKDLINS